MNELKPEDVMKALECCSDCECYNARLQEDCPYSNVPFCKNYLRKQALALLREKDAEIERCIKERDAARRDCAIAEQLHYECKRELEEMSDDILDSVRAERDRYKAESQQYQSAFLKATMDAEKERFQWKNICEPTYKNLLETARSDAITEFSKRMEKALTAQVNVSSNEIFAAFMWCLDLVKNLEKELKGATDGKTDL